MWKTIPFLAALLAAQSALGQDVYAFDDFPAPLGVYGLIDGQTDLEGLGHRGDNTCLMQPTVYVPGGRILRKTLGQPVNGNPYQITEYLDCSNWDGVETCTLNKGSPDAPNPVATGPGYDYTPLGQGDFTICPKDGGDCALLYACVREGGEITHDRTFPAGGSMVEAMLALWDGTQPGFRYLDNQSIRFED